jgi:thioesterase domain-containing protein
MWRKFAQDAEVVEIVGTHISMMHEPYVASLASDIRKRIDSYFAAST